MKELGHLLARLQILLFGKEALTLGVGKGVALGNANASLVRAIVLGL